jgi:FkbH-like protein
LTTRRYADADVRRFVESKAHDVFAVRLRDRFGDSGIVGVAILDHSDGRSRLDTFLLSCRVLGRGVEDALLAACTQASAARGSVDLDADFIPTAKNARARDFLPSRGFAAVEGTRHRRPVGDGGAYPEHFASVVVTA